MQIAHFFQGLIIVQRKKSEGHNNRTENVLNMNSLTLFATSATVMYIICAKDIYSDNLLANHNCGPTGLWQLNQWGGYCFLRTNQIQKEISHGNKPKVP